MSSRPIGKLYLQNKKEGKEKDQCQTMSHLPLFISRTNAEIKVWISLQYYRTTKFPKWSPIERFLYVSGKSMFSEVSCLKCTWWTMTAILMLSLRSSLLAEYWYTNSTGSEHCWSTSAAHLFCATHCSLSWTQKYTKLLSRNLRVYRVWAHVLPLGYGYTQREF